MNTIRDGSGTGAASFDEDMNVVALIGTAARSVTLPVEKTNHSRADLAHYATLQIISRGPMLLQHNLLAQSEIGLPRPENVDSHS
jgi:hypothetical protein